MAAHSDDTAPIARTINETCKASGFGRDTIYRAIRTGKLIARKHGKRTVILDRDLRAFLDALPTMRAAS
jgi:hypothetical protein